MLTSEELFPPEYCFVGRCSSHLAPFLPPPLRHRHSLLLSLSLSLPDDIVLTRLGSAICPSCPRPVANGVTHASFSSLCNTLFRAFLRPNPPSARLVSPPLVAPLRPTSPRIARGNFQIIFTPPLPRGDPPTRRVAYIDNNGIHVEETRAGLVTSPVRCTFQTSKRKKVKRTPIILGQLNPLVVCGSMPLLSPRYS